ARRPVSTGPEMLAAPLTLNIPDLPYSLNQWSRDWKKRHQRQESDYWRVWNAIGNRRHTLIHLHGAWFDGPVKLEFVFHVPGKKRLDLDNLVPKTYIDAMRRCGL